ncbi:MAG: DnaB-like helicase C-terminal domain-containing protein [Candidatus Dormibacteria bacterium]
MAREAELISRIVIAHEITPDSPLLRPEYFQAFAEEWKFLAEYYKQFASLPNRATFQTQFPDFPFADTEHTAQWLADEFAQDYIARALEQAAEELKSRAEINPREAAKTLRALADRFAPYTTSGIGSAPDLLDPLLRVEELERRRRVSGLAGVSLGFDLLDQATDGTQSGELEVYFARTGQGKSLMLLFGALAAVRQGRRVSFISPEMSRFEMGVRLDAYTLHASSSALVGGRVDDDEMAEFRRKIAQHKGEFANLPPLWFREPSDIGRPFSVADVAKIIEADRPDVVCLDGLMLIEPVQSDRDIRKRIINTMSELKALTVDTGVPIRIAHQANRDSDMTRVRRLREATLDDALPQLAHMAESGAVEQYTNRAIAMLRRGDRLYLCIRKNRNGPAGLVMSVAHDIDRGRFTDARMEAADGPLNSPADYNDGPRQERDTF